MRYTRRRMRSAAALTVCIGTIAVLGIGRSSGAASPAVRESATTIRVPQANADLVLWNEAGPGGTSAPWYEIRVNGRVVDSHPADYVLGFGYHPFDPLRGEPDIPAALEARADSKLHIVQVVVPPWQVFSDEIARLGGTVRHYIAQYAYLVEMDPAVRAAVKALPWVRWVGPYEPAYRLEDFMVRNVDRAAQLYPRQRYNIEVLAVEQKRIVAGRLSAIGAQVDQADAGYRLISATLTPAELFQLVQWDEVNFVDRWSAYEADMNHVRNLDGGNHVESVAGYAGQGVRGEIFDGGFNLRHRDFESRPLIQHPPGSVTGWDGHGAACSGINFGDGTGMASARGILPMGQGIVADQSFVGLTGVSRYNHDQELVRAPYFAVFQSASVGEATTTQYTTISADTDRNLFDSDMVRCQSQSNTGSQLSRPEAWAKNVLSVGGIYHFDNESWSDDRWFHPSSCASIGPASDGRIKPTLSNVYDAIHTVSCCGPATYTDDFCCTSGATPITAGHVGLFYEMWNDGIFGNTVNPDSTVFGNRCHRATAIAMVVNTARQYSFTGTGDDLTRTHQGWGVINVQNLYDLREHIYVEDQLKRLAQFDSSEVPLTAIPGDSALKVTMHYPDLPGNPSVQSQHRINALALEVISPSGIVYRGNNGLLEGIWSIPGGSPDDKNTLQCVYVLDPEPGTWRVIVKALQVVQDAWPATPAFDVPYSLVVCGALPPAAHVQGGVRPGNLGLVRSGPNPMSREAHLTCSLIRESDIRLDVFDAQGRLVRHLHHGRATAGTHRITWDGTAEGGVLVPAGIYFARLFLDGEVSTQKLVVVR